MNVVECDVPSGSVLSRELIERAYFRDSYRVLLSRRELGVVDIFFGIFGHHPPWMKLLLIVRNKVASLAGLDAPTAAGNPPTTLRATTTFGDRQSREGHDDGGATPKPGAVRGTHAAPLGTLAFRVGRRVRISFAPAGSHLRT